MQVLSNNNSCIITVIYVKNIKVVSLEINHKVKHLSDSYIANCLYLQMFASMQVGLEYLGVKCSVCNFHTQPKPSKNKHNSYCDN